MRPAQIISELSRRASACRAWFASGRENHFPRKARNFGFRGMLREIPNDERIILSETDKWEWCSIQGVWLLLYFFPLGNGKRGTNCTRGKHKVVRFTMTDITVYNNFFYIYNIFHEIRMIFEFFIYRMLFCILSYESDCQKWQRIFRNFLELWKSSEMNKMGQIFTTSRAKAYVRMREHFKIINSVDVTLIHCPLRACYSIFSDVSING